MKLSARQRSVLTLLFLGNCCVLGLGLYVINSASSPELPELVQIPTLSATDTQHPAPTVTAAPTLTFTPAETPTSGPTTTPRPTSTPKPTSTPRPTATASLSPEQAIAQWGTVDIRTLVKNPDNYIGSELRYKGEVFTISESWDGAVMQIWVEVPGGNTYDREAVLLYWTGNTEEVFEGTVVECVGYGLGSISGTNAFGGTVVQPAIQCEYFRRYR